MTTQPTQPSRLGKLLAAGNGRPTPTEPPTSRLGKMIAGGRCGEDVTLPKIGLVRIELVGTIAAQEIEAATHRRMAELGVAYTPLTEPRYEAERALRMLTVAVVDPQTRAPVGSYEEWGVLAPRLLNAAWTAYLDLEDRLDPMSTPLTLEEAEAITAAIKKKDAATLRSFGIGKVSLWPSSTAGQQLISPPPKSTNGESSTSGSTSE